MVWYMAPLNPCIIPYLFFGTATGEKKKKKGERSDVVVCVMLYHGFIEVGIAPGSGILLGLRDLGLALVWMGGADDVGRLPGCT